MLMPSVLWGGAVRKGVSARGLTLVYLQASRQLLEARLTSRAGHFAGIKLIDSQLALLKEPADALMLDASQPPDELVRTIRLTFDV